MQECKFALAEGEGEAGLYCSDLLLEYMYSKTAFSQG